MISSKEIAFIGAGRIGRSLAKALLNCGYKIKVLIDKDGQKLKNSKVLDISETYTTELAEISTVDILFIAVPDDQINLVVDALITIVKNKKIANYIFHTSGVLSSEVLSPLKPFGMAIGSLHPIQSFSGAKEDYKKYSGIYFGIDGDNEAVRKAKHIVKALNSTSIDVPKEHKTAYHLACTIASNCLNSLLFCVVDILKNIGMAEKEAFDTVLPLINTTLKNIDSEGLEKALTGPVARGDVNTVEKHLRLLQSEFPKYKRIYEELGHVALTYDTVKKNISEQNYRLLTERLNPGKTLNESKAD